MHANDDEALCTMSTPKKVIVVGGGPAGMFAAWNLAEKCEVHLFEQSSSLGRKLLVAGKGGLKDFCYKAVFLWLRW